MEEREVEDEDEDENENENEIGNEDGMVAMVLVMEMVITELGKGRRRDSWLTDSGVLRW